MAAENRRGGSPADPLEEALSEQLQGLERITVRGFQILSVAGIALGVVIGITLSRGVGFGCALASALYAAWFFTFGRMLARDRASMLLRYASNAVEGSVPWLFTLVIALREGPVYVLASWVPPMLFCTLMVAYSARLRPRACLVVAVVGAVAYPVLYGVVIRARLPPESASLLVTRWPMQITRSFSLLLAGVVGAVVASGMRRAIARAESAVRQKDLFGKYRLVHKIASGGMGMVFEALYCPEGGFERRVAVKRIHPQFAADEKFVSAFRDEAELSARLAHPGIVQVLDFGRVGDSFFLAMEYVDGMTLNALVFRINERGEKLAPPVVGHVLREVLGALAHAHEGARGPDGRPLRVVHRDLCPPNVLVSRNGEVKLTDFGIARSLSDAGVSMTHNVVGHVGYMAPEQAKATFFDARADLFPVGVIAWELLTLRPLFRRETEAASLMSLLTDEVLPVHVIRPELDARWSAWIGRALSRDPAQRFPSAAAMLEELAQIPESRGAGATEELAALVERLQADRAAGAALPDEAPTQVVTAPPREAMHEPPA